MTNAEKIKKAELIEAADWIMGRLGVGADDPALKGCTLELQDVFAAVQERRQER